MARCWCWTGASSVTGPAGWCCAATLTRYEERLARATAHVVNVLDPDALDLPLPEFVNDLPGGAGRLIQRAEGYRATIVNGQVALEDGAHSGGLPGVLLRSAP